MLLITSFTIVTLMLMFAVCFMWIVRNDGTVQVMTLNLARPFNHFALALEVAPLFAKFMTSCEKLVVRMGRRGGAWEEVYDHVMQDSQNMQLFVDMYAPLESLKMTRAEREDVWETVLLLKPIPAEYEAGDDVAAILA